MQRALGEHKAPGVLAQMARCAQQLLRQLQPPAQAVALRQGGVASQALECRLKCLMHHLVAMHARVLACHGLHQGVVHPQGHAHIAQGAAWPVADDGGGQGGTLAAVFLVDVLNHFLAALVFKVHVDVGRLVARAADETLKQQGAARGVNLGDAKAVTHRRIGRRAAPLAQDVAAAGKAHQVVYG